MDMDAGSYVVTPSALCVDTFGEGKRLHSESLCATA